MEAAADAGRHQPQSRDGPVGLRPPVDQGARAGGTAGGRSLLARDPDLPGRAADDGIAIFTIPLSVLGAMIGLYATGNTINVMTLAGLALAIGPLVDSAIICLENTHRHLSPG